MNKRITLFIGLIFALNLINSNVHNSNALLFEFGKILYAQPKYPYKEYKDRKEGIIEDIELVSGEKLVLISANIENKESIPDAYPAWYYLGFYLRESARVNIEVKEIDKSYLMKPLQQVYPPGPNIFSWPSKIPLYYKITLKDLLPVVEIYSSEISTIVPIVLYYKKPYSNELTYNFCFIPQNRIKVLEYKIYNLTTNQLVFSGKLKDLEMEKEFYIQWNSRDHRNIPVNNGTYLLNVKAIFEPPLGSTFSPPVTLNYKFYHFAELLKNELFTRK